MDFHRADVAVLKKLGIENLDDLADLYSQYRWCAEQLYGSAPLPEWVLVQIAVQSGAIESVPLVAPAVAKPLRIDLGDGVPRTIEELNGARTTKPKAKSDVWRKGRLLNYERTRSETDPDTGKKETFAEVIPALYVKKTKTGRFVIEVEGKNITVAPDKVMDAEHETIRRDDRQHGTVTFERQSAKAALALV